MNEFGEHRSAIKENKMQMLSDGKYKSSLCAFSLTSSDYEKYKPPIEINLVKSGQVIMREIHEDDKMKFPWYFNFILKN